MLPAAEYTKLIIIGVLYSEGPLFGGFTVCVICVLTLAVSLAETDSERLLPTFTSPLLPSPSFISSGRRERSSGSWEEEGGRGEEEGGRGEEGEGRRKERCSKREKRRNYLCSIGNYFYT